MQVDQLQKVTVQISAHLLKDAQNITGAGITHTITAGLEKIAMSAIYKKMLVLKGVGMLDLDLEALREDRDT